jgi:hypothetical protein
MILSGSGRRHPGLQCRLQVFEANDGRAGRVRHRHLSASQLRHFRWLIGISPDAAGTDAR